MNYVWCPLNYCPLNYSPAFAEVPGNYGELRGGITGELRGHHTYFKLFSCVAHSRPQCRCEKSESYCRRRLNPSAQGPSPQEMPMPWIGREFP